MNLDCISTLIVEAGLGVVGQTLFQDLMPDTVSRGVLLKSTVGGDRVDRYMPGYFRTARLQIIVRAADIEDGNTLSMAVMKAVTFRAQPPRTFLDSTGATLMTLNHAYPDALPSKYPRMPGGEYEWSTNFDVNYLMAL